MDLLWLYLTSLVMFVSKGDMARGEAVVGVILLLLLLFGRKNKPHRVISLVCE